MSILVVSANSFPSPHHSNSNSNQVRVNHPPTDHLRSLISSSKTLAQLKEIHAQIIRRVSGKETHLLTALISSSSSLNHLHYANLVFHQIPDPNVFHWTTIIASSSRNGRPFESILLFKSMLESNTNPNNFTLSSILSACASLCAINEGKQVHSLYMKYGFHWDIFIDTALIHFYGKCSQPSSSLVVFDKMPSHNLASINAMIFSYSNSGDMESAESLFQSMPVRDCVSYTSMMTGYGDAGDVEKARQLFDEMPVRNLGSWNSMISVYSHSELSNEVLSTFNEMLASGFYPNELTLSSLISISGRDGFSSMGRVVHSYVVKLGVEVDGFLGAGLIDMYSKSGYIDLACQVFVSIPCRRRSLGTWNAIIFALGSHGEGEASLAKLSEMEMEGIKPSELTMLGILSACSHSGLVQEGCDCFSSMVDKHNLAPRLEHYACLVDLLGRAGDLRGAFNVIRRMPILPDVFTWGSLLNACRIHSNEELGCSASAKILELDSGHSGGYVLLSNIHSSAGKWDSVTRIRVRMKEEGIQKPIPGCSCIEVNEVVHRFYAMDTMHPQSQQVYEMLACLTSELITLEE